MALLVEFTAEISIETNQKVLHLYELLLGEARSEISSLIPAYHSLVIKYRLPPKQKKKKKFIQSLLAKGLSCEKKNEHLPPVVLEIPECYAPEMALDLEQMCHTKNLSPHQLITLHSAPTYHVYMLGFTPGFPYLGGLDNSLAMPRKKNPRLSIPKGSVAIANEQTGIYPTASPGGWQIIGRTPLELFKKNEKPLINIGDKIKFVPISIKKFYAITNSL